MIELKLTLDLSDRFVDAIDRLASAIESSGCACSVQSVCEHVENVPEISPESVSPIEAGNDTLADEIAQIDPKESQESVPMPEPVEPAKEITPAPVEKPSEAVEKPKRSRAKKADTPKPDAETVDPLTGEVLPDRKTEPAEKIEAPAAAEPPAPAVQDSDPMQGMTVIQALQAITREASERGVDMAAMNGRIRAKADELGLAYGSAACLIKAVGYVEARRVALGER